MLNGHTLNEIGLNQASDPPFIGAFSDQIALASAFSSILIETEYQLSDSILFQDKVKAILTESLTDLFVVNDTVEIGAVVEILADVLKLSDDFVALIEAELALADSLGLSDSFGLHYRFELADTLALVDQLAWKISVVQTLADTLSLTDSNSITLLVKESLADTFEATDSFAQIAQVVLEFSDIFALNGQFKIDGESYTVWALNPKSVSPYKLKYLKNINSMTRIAGKNLICADDGIYEVGGDSDDGTVFDAFVKTGFMDFNDPERHYKGEHLKQLLNGYMVLTADGETLIKVTTTRRGEAKETWFKCVKKPSVMSKVQLPLSNSLRSVLFQFEIKPLEKKPMKLREVEVIPLFLNRSI